jgi:hypothetical protein
MFSFIIEKGPTDDKKSIDLFLMTPTKFTSEFSYAIELTDFYMNLHTGILNSRHA